MKCYSTLGKLGITWTERLNKEENGNKNNTRNENRKVTSEMSSTDNEVGLGKYDTHGIYHKQLLKVEEQGQIIDEVRMN